VALTILVRSGDGTSVPRITFDAPRIVIGRGEGCEVRLPDPSVSHRHASIRQRGTEYIVLDEGSTNGTFVGPVRLSPQAPRMLKSGDLVRVGRVWLEVCIEQVPPTVNAPSAARELSLALVATALAAEGTPASLRVRVVEGPGSGAELVLDAAQSYVVGRMPSAALVVDDPDVSRRQVELARRGERLVVRDLGSKGGTRVGERVLGPKEELVWPKGESLFVGKARLVYEDPVGEALEQLESAADERIADSELIDPPTGTSGSASGAPGSMRSSPIPRPRSTPPAPRSERPPAPAPVGWTMTDVAIALLALIVLGLSAAGLVWLIKGE
jgi:pSer/pThr/pTyr-binding forkhead associated (FHA) protein